MRGILMFNSLNDLIFFKADEAVSQHIQHLASKDCLSEDIYNGKDEIDKNVVMQIFSPLIASFKVFQTQFDNKLRFVECEDGVLLVFNQILNYIIIAIGNSELENVDTIHRRISIFIVFVKMLYGPSPHMINNTIPVPGKTFSRAQLLSLLIDQYTLLKMEQQMFLIEAVERLLINQDITATCVNLLQDALHKVRSLFKDQKFSHSFLLVDTKLLALYSSRNSSKLLKGEILLLILVAEVLKSQSTDITLKNDSKGPAQCVSTSNVTLDIDSEQFFVPRKTLIKTQTDQKHKKDHSRNGSMQDLDSEHKGIYCLLLFMKSHFGPNVPHLVYFIKVHKRITLVIVSEVCDKGQFSSCTSSLIDMFHKLQNNPVIRPCHHLFESLETSLTSLINASRKMKASNNEEHYIKRLVVKWEQLKKCGLKDFLQNSSEKNIPSRIDSVISSMGEVLKSIFKEVVMHSGLSFEENIIVPQTLNDFLLVQKMAQKRLRDLVEYLKVRAVQNVTMTSYLTEFPGLIHFLYIDRNSDCLIAPSVVLKKGHLDGTASLKERIWKMVEFGNQYVDGANNLCCMWKETDLQFLYSIWFEDSTGKTIKPVVLPDLQDFPKKGILCGNFYRKLTEECFPAASYDHIHCYELYCIHLESTKEETILEHARRLSAILWDYSGAYRTSLDLL